MRKQWIRTSAVWLVSLTCASALPVAAVSAAMAMGSFADEFVTERPASSTSSVSESPRQMNILLLGVGDQEHTAANLTDAIIIAGMDPESRSVTLLSIPRDLYLTDSQRISPNRINALYALRKRSYKKDGKTETGASLLAMRDLADELQERLGVPIDGVAKMDFTGFEQLIDAVGGVDIDVPKKIVDSTYPLKENEVGVFSIDAGPQHLSGATALRYARSRHSTSDFDRSGRQQQILHALVEKAKGQGIFKSLQMAQSLQEFLRGHVEWTYSPQEIFGLTTVAMDLDPARVVTMNLNTQTGGDRSDALPGGFVIPAPAGLASGAVLVPRSLTDDPADWGQIRTLAQLLFTRRDLTLTRPVITITHTPKAKLPAHRLRNEFLRYGFSMGENQNEKVLDLLSFLHGQEGSPSATQLVARLSGLPFSWRSIGDGSSAQIQITLGDEYRFVPFEGQMVKE